MASAVDLLERLVAERRLRHANHPLLAAAATSAKVEIDAANNRKFSKKKSTARIDPLVALTIALSITTTKKDYEPRYQFFVLG